MKLKTVKRMKTSDDHTFKGAGKKFLLEITGPGFSMHEDNFTVTLRQGKTVKTFQKTDLVEDTVIIEGSERHDFYLCLDSSPFVPGIITCIVKAYVPDTDFPNGIRVEIDKFDLTCIEPV